MFRETLTNIENLWQEFKTKRRQRTADVMILPDHLDHTGLLDVKLNDTYINIVVNEVWLAKEKDLWNSLEPMVFAATEVLYLNRDKGKAEAISLPLVIGQNFLANLGSPTDSAPQGISFQNTIALGPIPYIGGPITWTIILYQIPLGSNAQAMLRLLESISGTVASVTGLGGFLPVSQAILNGVDMLLDTQTPVPLIGKRIAFQPDNTFKAGYYALINASESTINQQNLWIREGRLYEGESLEDSSPFTSNDFILFSIFASNYRTDDVSLDFYPYLRNAIELVPTNLTQAALNMQTLVQEIRNSPDLTKPDKYRLINKYAAEYKEVVLHNRALLLELEPTEEWKKAEEEEALQKGAVTYSKGGEHETSDDGETEGEVLLKGLDPRFS